MRLDELDLKILTLLLADARASFRDIAERVGSTTPTVSARVRALEDIGLLRGYHARLDRAVLGGTQYVATLTVSPAAARRVFDVVVSLPGVFAAQLLAGGRVVAQLHAADAQAFAAFDEAVATLDDVVTMDVTQVLARHESAGLGALPEQVVVACHQCNGPIHGDPVKGRFGGRAHVFCCRQCLGAFRERFEKTSKAAGGGA